jgi:hypothetical protein
VPDSIAVRLKVLSPVHIGSGATLTKLDYFLDAGKLCVVDHDSLFRDPGFATQREAFLKSAPSGEPISKLVTLDMLWRHVAYRIGVSQAAQADIQRSPTQLKTCIKSAGRVYIPGSSVKGAILSALCWQVLHDGWFQDDPARRDSARVGIEQLLLQDSRPDTLLATILPRLGGRAADQLGKFTHWLDISDTDLKPPSECLGLSLADVKSATEPGRAPRPGRNLSFLCETIQAGREFTFTIKLDPDSSLTVEGMLKSVADFYTKVAEKDSVRGDATPKLPATGLIRLGQGSGAYAMSLLVLAGETELNVGRDGYRVRLPKSRKRAGQGNIAMGWAQMEMAKTE